MEHVHKKSFEAILRALKLAIKDPGSAGKRQYLGAHLQLSGALAVIYLNQTGSYRAYLQLVKQIGAAVREAVLSQADEGYSNLMLDLLAVGIPSQGSGVWKSRKTFDSALNQEMRAELLVSYFKDLASSQVGGVKEYIQALIKKSQQRKIIQEVRQEKVLLKNGKAFNLS